MRAAAALAALAVLCGTAAAEPEQVSEDDQEQVIHRGAKVGIEDGRVRRAILLLEDHFLISRATAEELYADRALADSLAEQLRASEAERARGAARVAELEADDGGAWKWAIAGGLAVGLFGAGVWVGASL